MNPTRSCVACRKKNNKKDLYRIAIDKDGKAIYDVNQKLSLRAIYICKDKTCLNNIKKCIEKNKFKSKMYIETDSFLKLIDELE